MLAAAKDAGPDAALGQQLIDIPDHPFDIGPIQGMVPIHAGFDLGIDIRHEVAETDVFQLGLDAMQAQPVGQRGINIHRFLGDKPPLDRLLELQRAHVVQPVGQFDQDDADVLGHGQDHFADILRLGLFLGFKRNKADLGHAVHNVGHFLAEKAFKLIHRGLGVLHGIVQEPGGDAGGVKTHVGQDVGGFQRMGQIGFAGKPHLPGMGGSGKHVRLGDNRLFLLGEVDGGFIQDFVNTDHGRPGLVLRDGEGVTAGAP